MTNLARTCRVVITTLLCIHVGTDVPKLYISISRVELFMHGMIEKSEQEKKPHSIARIGFSAKQAKTIFTNIFFFNLENSSPPCLSTVLMKKENFNCA